MTLKRPTDETVVKAQMQTSRNENDVVNTKDLFWPCLSANFDEVGELFRINTLDTCGSGLGSKIMQNLRVTMLTLCDANN